MLKLPADREKPACWRSAVAHDGGLAVSPRCCMESCARQVLRWKALAASLLCTPRQVLQRRLYCAPHHGSMTLRGCTVLRQSVLVCAELGVVPVCPLRRRAFRVGRSNYAGTASRSGLQALILVDQHGRTVRMP